jgi:hypothetical protein
MKCLTASFPCPPRPFLSLRDQKSRRDKDPQIWTPQALRHDEVTARHSAMVAAPVSELAIYLSELCRTARVGSGESGPSLPGRRGVRRTNVDRLIRRQLGDARYSLHRPGDTVSGGTRDDADLCEDLVDREPRRFDVAGYVIDRPVARCRDDPLFALSHTYHLGSDPGWPGSSSGARSWCLDEPRPYVRRR